jgi:hypothetical protein
LPIPKDRARQEPTVPGEPGDGHTLPERSGRRFPRYWAAGFFASSAGFSGAGVVPWSGLGLAGGVVSAGGDGGGAVTPDAGCDSSLSFFFSQAPNNNARPSIAASTPTAFVLIIFLALLKIYITFFVSVGASRF